jgi:hypothetical protein
MFLQIENRRQGSYSESSVMLPGIMEHSIEADLGMSTERDDF